jgi:dTDP-4-dehydrorhamnose 3,5-epimerase
MKFTPLELKGAFVVELTPHIDARGAFARTFCERTFKDAGLWHHFPQHNASFNKIAGTVRGMHYQRVPDEEVKIVRCLTGAIDDIIVDIRPDSSTFRKHIRIELSQDNGRSLYIPAGFAHGFQTLADNTTVAYLMGTEYRPESNTGFHWNDPQFSIEWHQPITSISDKDAHLPIYGRPD